MYSDEKTSNSHVMSRHRLKSYLRRVVYQAFVLGCFSLTLKARTAGITSMKGRMGREKNSLLHVL
jgi:hypothetical protein